MTEARSVPSIRTVSAPGTWRPNPLQDLVLDAALGDRDRAASAFARWVAATGFDDVERGSFRVLPLVAAHFDRLDITGPWSAHLRGILRRSWYENQVLLHATLPAVDALQGVGIDVALLKGGSLGVLAYPGIGCRPMQDLDVLVTEERAGDALAVLLRKGWVLGPESVPAALRRGVVPGPFRRLRHSVGLRGPAGHEIDLHWHATYAWCWPGADHGLWATTREFGLQGRTLRALSAADELMVACVHGLLVNDEVPPIRWLTDAVMVLRSEPIEWEGLLDRARAMRVEPQLALALGYVRVRFDAPVPEWVLVALRERRPGFFERQWLVARVDGHEKRSLAAHYGGYLRGARAETRLRRYAGGLPEHLAFLLGCESTARLPTEIYRRANVRIRQRRNRSRVS
jgi:hypothetical protein